MRRTARLGNAASLELLLDTMCNAFGGVVFIAMLLAVMSHFAEVKVAPDDGGYAEALSRRAELQAEVRRLRPALRRREELLASAAMLRETLPLLDELHAAEQEAAALAERASAAAERLAAAERAAERARREKRPKEAELAQARERAAALSDALQSRRSDAARELRMPRIRRLRKAPFWSIVKNDRLYVLYRPGGFLARERVNTDAVRHTSYPGYSVFEAIPGKGVGLKGDWQNAPEVRQILSNVPAATNILYFAVYPDSYGTFRQVRDFFVARGYDYYWAVRPEMGEPLRLRLVRESWFDGM